jgi:hypothetical protein
MSEAAFILRSRLALFETVARDLQAGLADLRSSAAEIHHDQCTGLNNRLRLLSEDIARTRDALRPASLALRPSSAPLPPTQRRLEDYASHK